MQKTGVLDVMIATKYPAGHYAVCKGVSPEKSHHHVNHMEQRGSLLHSKGVNKQPQDQFERTMKMLSIQR